ncbi:type II secretion system minor pseudopilin GspK [Hyphomonas sp.]|uniref:type II secretion system minor pseudopilin GspK n=1 Tax=Hyphomonas sp. TaxID=87 RepID=UPI001BCF1CE7|nr:type II secretion system minor pseudopilin GspK [Hyphomonas sp.]
MIPCHSQRGAALLSILLIVAALAVAALIATTAIARQTDLAKLAARRSDAGWAAHSAEALALSAVAELTALANGQVTAQTPGLGEPVVIPVKGGIASLEVRDATNCFNLNALANADEGAATLARLSWVTMLSDLEIPATEANSLANALADWLDSDGNTRQGGAEDAYYLTLSPQYRAANQVMTSPRELASIQGYTRSLRDTLAPVVCALPETQPSRLNINTLRPEQASLLRAIYSQALSITTAERIIAGRPEQGWAGVADFEALPDVRAIPEGQKRTESLSTTSFLYLAEGRTTLDGGSWPFSFLISANGGSEPETIWRRMGEE